MVSVVLPILKRYPKTIVINITAVPLTISNLNVSKVTSLVAIVMITSLKELDHAGQECSDEYCYYKCRYENIPEKAVIVVVITTTHNV
jgi:hypothetical protein